MCYSNSKNRKLTISLWMVGCGHTMFDSEKSKELLAESIAEFTAPVRNDSSGATISSEHQVEFLGNSRRLFVGDWDHFCPFAEIILDAENVLVTSAFTHLHQIN